jgi:hypothetical protein
MDVNRAAVTAEPYYIRAQSWLRLLVGIAGLGLLLLGIYNMFAPLLLDVTALRFYEQGWFVAFDRGAFFFEDIVVMAVGAVVAWWA